MGSCCSKSERATATVTPTSKTVPFKHEWLQKPGKVGLLKRWLKASYSDVNERDEEGWSIVHYICYYQKPELLELVVEKGANINIADDMGLTPLHMCCRENNIEAVKRLLQLGADTTLLDNNKMTALQEAVYYKRSEIADMFRRRELDGAKFALLSAGHPRLGEESPVFRSFFSQPHCSLSLLNKVWEYSFVGKTKADKLWSRTHSVDISNSLLLSSLTAGVEGIHIEKTSTSQSGRFSAASTTSYKRRRVKELRCRANTRN